jgi:serine protease Do
VLSVRVVGSDGQIRQAEWLGTDPKTQLAFVRIGSVGQKGLAPVAWETATATLGDPLLVLSLTPNALGNKVRVDRSRVAFADTQTLGLTPQHPHAIGALVTTQAGKPLGLLAHHLPSPASGDVLRPDLIALANAGYVVLPPSFKALIASPPKTVGRPAKRRARAWLGIKPQVLNPELAESLALDIDTGVHVASLYDGPAKGAGIQTGDVLLRLDGESLDLDPGESFRDIIEDYPAGSKVSLLVRRKGKIKEFEVELSRSPVRPQDAERARIGEAGLLLRALTFFDRVEIGLAPNSPGAVVLEIDPDGAGSRAGLRVGDVITKIDGKSLQSLAELRRRLSESGALPLTVKRSNEELTLRVQH